ncbi:hypothetical protein [Micromonospora sp. NPDC005113]
MTLDPSRYQKREQVQAANDRRYRRWVLRRRIAALLWPWRRKQPPT